MKLNPIGFAVLTGPDGELYGNGNGGLFHDYNDASSERDRLLRVFSRANPVRLDSAAGEQGEATIVVVTYSIHVPNAR